MNPTQILQQKAAQAGMDPLAYYMKLTGADNPAYAWNTSNKANAQMGMSNPIMLAGVLKQNQLLSDSDYQSYINSPSAPWTPISQNVSMNTQPGASTNVPGDTSLSQNPVGSVNNPAPLTTPPTTQDQTFQNTQTRQQQIDNSTAQGVIQPQMQALNNTPTSSNPATNPAIPNTITPTNSNISPQISALNTSTAPQSAIPTTNNGVGNSTSGNQMLPGQTGASFGNISQQMTPQDQQRQAIKTDPNNITGYQDLNTI